MALLNNRGKVYLGDTLISGLPELTNQGSATDFALDKQFIDADGNVVTGTLLEANEIQEKIWATSDYSFGGTAGGTTFNVSGMYNGSSGVPDGLIVRPGAGLGVRNAPTEFFGDARPEDVTKGKKFTSVAGLLVEGTHECEGVTLPELSNPGTASDMASGKELIDASGNIVTGTLKDGGVLELVGGDVSYYGQFAPGSGGIPEVVTSGIKVTANADTDRIIRAGDEVSVITDHYDKFGNATAEDVRAGKHFTSAAGYMAVGTMEVIDCGQYCWKKYAVNKSYKITRETLGTTAPDDLGGSYQSYTITDDGYFQLNSGSITLSTYHLPSGASNGETKYIYYKEWKYALGDSNYEYSRLTLSDTYTEEKSDFLGYVISDDSTTYPEDGIAADEYWYVLVSDS